MFYKQYGKKLFDLMLAAILVGPFAIIILIAGTINIFYVGWPVFFTQKRVGKNGQVFTIYKLRTMSGVNNGSLFASSEEARITSYGKFLRKTRIDELPQIFNIIKGDMSLIGPRPEQPDFVTRYKKVISNYEKRHQVRPGITGLAQVENGYTDSDDGTRNKVRYDLLYLQKMSLGTDLNILYKTVFEVARMTG